MSGLWPREREDGCASPSGSLAHYQEGAHVGGEDHHENAHADARLSRECEYACVRALPSPKFSPILNTV